MRGMFATGICLPSLKTHLILCCSVLLGSTSPCSHQTPFKSQAKWNSFIFIHTHSSNFWCSNIWIAPQLPPLLKPGSCQSAAVRWSECPSSLRKDLGSGAELHRLGWRILRRSDRTSARGWSLGSNSNHRTKWPQGRTSRLKLMHSSQIWMLRKGIL